jgi:hypothetical protein
MAGVRPKYSNEETFLEHPSLWSCRFGPAALPSFSINITILFMLSDDCGGGGGYGDGGEWRHQLGKSR